MCRAKMCLRIFFFLSTVAFIAANKVLLSDMKVITLHKGKMTNARRSSPVPQLKCMGGSAQHKFQPKIVQCINQGSDGYDIQWECKTDMDNSYRFGRVEVSCEGYDYPNDPYVLKGSCGLEYTIDFTEEGYRKDKESGGKGYSYYDKSYNTESEGGLGGLLVFAGIAFAIYVIYTNCIAPQAAQHQHQATSGGNPTAPPPQPPPYGFKPEYSTGPPPYAPPSYESSTGYSSRPGYNSNSSTANDGPGFWTGAATGGLLGYLFGQGQNRGYNNYHTGWGRPHGFHSPRSSWGFSSSGGSSGSSPSSGSRMASGFGGTSRR